MKHSINVEMSCRDRGMDSGEKLIKKFFKKVKKEGIIQEHLDKTAFFMTPRQKLRQKRIKNKFMRQKNRK